MQVTKNSISVILQLYKPINKHTRQLIYINTWYKSRKAITPKSWKFAVENLAAPFQANVWVREHDLSEHRANNFTHILDPCTCKGSFPFSMAEDCVFEVD